MKVFKDDTKPELFIKTLLGKSVQKNILKKERPTFKPICECLNAAEDKMAEKATRKPRGMSNPLTSKGILTPNPTPLSSGDKTQFFQTVGEGFARDLKLTGSSI